MFHRFDGDSRHVLATSHVDSLMDILNSEDNHACIVES